MIDIKQLETSVEYLKRYRRDLENRGGQAEDVDRLMELNTQRKALIAELETKKAQQNRVGEIIAKKKRAKQEAGPELSEMQELSGFIKQLGVKVTQAQKQVDEFLAALPNHLDESVPVGKSEEDNQVVKNAEKIRPFNFQAKHHWVLGEELGIMDSERAGKVSGARFVFLYGAAARLERALINFMLDLQTQEFGYQEILPPFMAKSNSFFGTGQFPKFKEDVFSIQGTDFYLIPTAEVPVTNLYADEILQEAQLPVSFAAYSPCFRSEAGSYGKDTKGLIRQHQFEKVELVKFTHPDQSHEEHEKLTQHAEAVLQRLEIPYRVSLLCSKEIGFGAAKCLDIEVWLPGKQKFREISSCSNYESFQARRANIRFRAKGGGKPRFVHTLNGSGLAIGRTMVAIMENFQNEDGTIGIPKALQSYMNGLKKIEKNTKAPLC